MNILRKSGLALLILPLIALSGCSGNGLQNEKQVTAQEFATAVAGTEERNTANHAEAKQTLYVSNKGTTETVTAYTYNDKTAKWIPETTTTWTNDHASDCYIGIQATFTALGIKDSNFTFYTADNGFRMYATGTGTTQVISMYVVVEYIFNVAGFPTKFYQKTEATSSVGTGISQVDVSITYSTTN